MRKKIPSKVVSLLCFTIFPNTNMRKHFLLKDLLGIPVKEIMAGELKFYESNTVIQAIGLATHVK